MNPSSAPKRVGPAHRSDQLLHLCGDGLAPSSFPPTFSSPEPAEASPLPADNRLWLNYDQGSFPSGRSLHQPTPEKPVQGTEPGPLHPPSQNRDLLPQGEILQDEFVARLAARAQQLNHELGERNHSENLPDRSGEGREIFRALGFLPTTGMSTERLVLTDPAEAALVNQITVRLVRPDEEAEGDRLLVENPLLEERPDGGRATALRGRISSPVDGVAGMVGSGLPPQRAMGGLAGMLTSGAPDCI